MAIYHKPPNLFCAQFYRFLSCFLDIFILSHICLKKEINVTYNYKSNTYTCIPKGSSCLSCVFTWFVSGENFPRLNSCLSSIPMSHQRQMNKFMKYRFLHFVHFRGNIPSKTKNNQRRFDEAFENCHLGHENLSRYSTHHKRNNIVSLFLEPKQDTRCIKPPTVG